MPCHEVSESIWPPTTGARIGPRPVTSISDENSRDAAAPDRRSRTTARAITMPPRRPGPGRSESDEHETSGRGAQQRRDGVARIARDQRHAPPSRSLSGPNSSCPSASPATQAVSVSWTADALVSSARASRERRQVHVDRQRADRVDRPEHDDQPGDAGHRLHPTSRMSRRAPGYASPYGRRQRYECLQEVPGIQPHDDDLVDDLRSAVTARA